MTTAHAYGTRDMDWFWYGLTIILPFVAVFVAIWWLAHDRIGPGLAILLTAWVATSLWFVALIAIGYANV